MTDQDVKLPDLPERFMVMPALVLPEVHGMGGNTTVLRQEDVFSADQMRAYARQAALLERERCAKVCEDIEQDARQRLLDDGKAATAFPCAAAIRKGD